MDDARFEELWGRYARRILRYCAFSLGSREDAEDVAAETFSRLLRSGDRVRPDRVEAWLFAVARNLCTNQHRSRGHARGLLGKLTALGQPREPDPAEHSPDPEIWREVRRLNERARLIVYLRVVEERPFAEIAQATGASESATKMRYYRAIDTLRHNMHAEEPSVAPVSTGGVGDVD